MEDDKPRPEEDEEEEDDDDGMTIEPILDARNVCRKLTAQFKYLFRYLDYL